jgi:putative ABC transport system permease protein
MIQDLQYALRLIRKSPGAAIVAVLTVAIGVGANTAIFSVIRAVLLRPLPYTDADRIVALAESWPNLSGPRPISKLNYRDWAEQNTVFELTAAARWWTVTLSSGDQPVYLVGSLVSPSYFDVFGLHAALGRTFAPGDDQPGHADVVVLSHRLWASQFGSDPGIVGRSVRLDGEVCTVIGVMPAKTSVDFYAPALFRPLTFDVVPLRSDHELSAVAKLKHGVTIAQARTEMNAIGDRLADAYPESNKGYGVIVRPYPRPLGLDTEASLYLLFAAVGAVLLIGSVNLANLALARGVGRAREAAIRAALGAGRWRLVRQVMAEHLVIATGGGLCGVVVGYGVLLIIEAALPTTGLRAAFPPDTTIAMDGPVWLFALTLSVLSGFGFGLAPAIAVTHLSLIEVIKGGGGAVGSAGYGQRIARRTLVVLEVALAFVLLTGAGLLIQSFFALSHRIDSGFDSTNVLTAKLPIAATRFSSSEALNAYLDRIASRLQSLPGIRDVAFADTLPTEGTPIGRLFQIAGQPAAAYGSRPVAGFKVVSPSYFRALSLSLIAGRVLSDSDRGGAPLRVVINRTMARTYFQGVDPIGQRLLMKRVTIDQNDFGPDVDWTIVGVIADEGVSPFGDRAAEPAIYATREQNPTRYQTLLVRTAAEPTSVQTSIRAAVAAVDRGQALADVATLDQLKIDDVAPDRLRSALLTAFATVAVVLAAIGLYGVIAVAVAQRTRELGIRAALGASPANLLRLVVRQGMAMVAVGLGTGLVITLVVTPVLKTFLFGVGSSDPKTMAVAAGILTSVALMACYLPARRAATVDPLIASRTE